jgi:hypothetical protein
MKAFELHPGNRVFCPAWGKLVPATVTEVTYIPRTGLYNVRYDAEITDEWGTEVMPNCMMHGVSPDRDFPTV